jgi:magnesium chelatase family protein
MRQLYRKRLSGPLLDRFDLIVHVPRIIAAEWRNQSTPAQRPQLPARIPELQRGQALEEQCGFTEQERQFAESTMDRLRLSARGYDRWLRVSATIARIEHKNSVTIDHLAEALQYRVSIDRFS